MNNIKITTIVATVIISTLPMVAEMNLEESMYAPAREMMAMDEAMNRAIEQKRQENAAHPIVFTDDLFFHEEAMPEFVENNNSYILEQVLEDANQTEVKVTLEKNLLTITNTTKRSDTLNTGNSSSSSSYVSTTSQTLTIPEDADGDQMQKSYENGIIKIVLPKK